MDETHGDMTPGSQEVSDEALELQLRNFEPISVGDLSRAAGLMTEQILKFRRERNIATEAELEEPVEIQIGRFSANLAERRDKTGSYPNRINLDVAHTTGISRHHLDLRFDESGIIVANHSRNNSFLDGRIVPPNSFLINEESDHQVRLGPKAKPFTLNLRDYRTALTAEKNELQARKVQVMLTMEG